MKKNPEKENLNKEDVKEKEIKKGFFKKVWYSINKIEKYSELSAEGLGTAIKYLTILMMLLAVISSTITVYKTSLEIKSIASYIDEKSPELTYKDGTLDVNSQEVIIDNSFEFGKIIIDTKADTEEQTNKYITEINDEENAIIILKNKIILKETGLQETINYDYKALFEEIGITEFNKQDLVEYLSGSKMMNLYLNLFLALFIYAFMIYLINTLFNIAVISIFGYLATMILKLKVRYVAIFNMAVYAITLPTILNMIYLLINGFFNFSIKYFDVMYMLVASIYMIAAIFILKSEFNKKQGEVQKIIEVEKVVKEEIKENQEEKKKDKKDKKEDNSEDEQDGKDTNSGEEPEGSKA